MSGELALAFYQGRLLASKIAIASLLSITKILIRNHSQRNLGLLRSASGGRPVHSFSALLGFRTVRF